MILLLVLLLVGIPTCVPAAVLCARSQNGVLHDGNLKVRVDTCRWNERAVGIIEGTTVPVQGPPGPPGPAAALPALVIECRQGYVNGTQAIEEACGPTEQCVAGYSYWPSGYPEPRECGSLPGGEWGGTTCCKIVALPEVP